MNRNTWIIIIVSVIVIIGMIWIFNRGPTDPRLIPKPPAVYEVYKDCLRHTNDKDFCLKQMEINAK